MSDKSRPLSRPIRFLAGSLGLFFLVGGPLLAATGLRRPIDYVTTGEGFAGVWVAFLFLRAAWIGVSPGWPSEEDT